MDVIVSTHSRAKAAADKLSGLSMHEKVSTHSRAKAAALPHLNPDVIRKVSTHSRAKAAAYSGGDGYDVIK